MTTEPTRAVEVERKYDLEENASLPDWQDVPGVAQVSPAELRALDAQYFDTDGLALAHSGYALRRRTGGPDAGWHLKGPRTGDGRVEVQWPLGDDESMPDSVAAAVADLVSGEALRPIARIENARTAFHLVGEGGAVAEFVDDDVRTTDLRTGAQRAWREWEFELGPAAPADEAGRTALFAAAEKAIFAAGGRTSTSASKLGRALGARS